MDSMLVLPEDDESESVSWYEEPHATVATGQVPVFLRETLNDDVYQQAVQPITPDIRNSANVLWAEPHYDENRWRVAGTVRQ